MSSTRFPLPDASLMALPPATLAASAVSTCARVYGTTLDYTPGSLARLDAMIAAHLRAGRFTAENFPAMLALSLAAYVGETLRRLAPAGRWGTREENLYGTRLPFLVFARPDHELQINVGEDVMTALWRDPRVSLARYAETQVGVLKQTGFV
jgi:hypothetical protein